MKKILVVLSLLFASAHASVQAPISIGELIDKITILEIKTERISDKEKLEKINFELNELNETMISTIKIKSYFKKYIGLSWQIVHLRARLKEVNETLWDIEDKIRQKEANKEFDKEFVALARSVYKTNDRRCAIKREINLLCGSDIIEEKSYTKYE